MKSPIGEPEHDVARRACPARNEQHAERDRQHSGHGGRRQALVKRDALNTSTTTGAEPGDGIHDRHLAASYARASSTK